VLESLSLRGNALGADATRSVCTLIGQTHSLLHLDIGESHMQSKDVIMLAEALVGHPTVVSLDVGRAHLSALDMQFLAEALANNKSLHRIVLDGNALRDDGAVKLFAGLARNKSLQRVSLRQCRLTSLVAPDVLTLGLANAYLRFLDLTENEFADDERAAMVRQVNTRPALTQILLH
jgi:Ran GTPase-activating protein (RanGAP) involved in mRNA processing and transport